jgi:hypothetical protein
MAPRRVQIVLAVEVAAPWFPAISFVTGTGPMVRSSSEGFDQWAFAIDRRRRALLGKMDMLKG